MRYRIEKELGRGGMGAVYAARDTWTGRRVALKVVLGRAEGELRERFVAEARAVAALDHPSLVPVHTIGAEGRDLYFTMEAVEGRTLAAALDAGDLPLREAIAALAEVARGVAHAHDKGLVHRDLKPGNLMLTPGGGVKILDWGLVRAAPGGGPAGSVVPGDPHLTRTGAMLGTPAYMAPEQGDGRPEQVGRPADVWALGAILYHVLAGSPPMTGSLVQILGRLATGDIEPPAARAPDRRIPPALEAIRRRAMARQPADRYPSASLFAADLEAWLAGRPVSVLPPPWPVRLALRIGRHRLASAAVALAVLSAGSVGFAVWRDRRAAAAIAARVAADDRARRQGDHDEALAAVDSALGQVGSTFAVWSEALETLERNRTADERTLAGRPDLPPMDPGETLVAFEKRTLDACAAFDWPAFEAAAARLGGASPDEAPLESARRLLERRLAAARGALADAARTAAALEREGGEPAPAPAGAAARLDGIEMTVALARFDVERSRVRRLLAVGDLDPDLRRRAKNRLAGLGRIDLGPIPPGCRSTLLRATGEALWTGGDPLAGLEPVAGDGELVSAGEYVLLLERGDREVRHAFLVEVGRTSRVEPFFPERFPPGTVYVAPASFLAGEAAANTFQALPRHRARVERGFFLQETEVTIDDWREFLAEVGESPGLLPMNKLVGGVEPLLHLDGGLWVLLAGRTADWDHPVFGVSYLACAAYARWRSQRDPYWRWRLPTASEWSLAAGGPLGRLHPWGGPDSFENARVEFRESIRGEAVRAPASDYADGRSLYGARQMAGNVWEWVASPFSDRWVEMFGGGWLSDERETRVASRFGIRPGGVDHALGFRLVAVPPEAR